MPVEFIAPAELDFLLSVYQVSKEDSASLYEPTNHPVFHAEDFEALRAFTFERICLPGEIILRENDLGDNIYIIRSGRAAVIKGDAQAPVILGFRVSGEVMGEMALLENQPRSATVVALDAMVLWGMNRQTVDQLFRESPGLSIKILGMLSSRLRKSDEQRRLEAMTVKQRDEALRGLREQVMRDPLTGLFNRRYMEETLTREIARAQRDGVEVGVLMMDVDHFKRVNDTYGHATGDAVLQSLARMLTACVRAEDVPCRYGGEEFIVIMPGAPLPVIVERAEAIRQSFQALRIPYGEQTLSATISIGAASCPLHGTSREAVLRCADQALYQAKCSGRNRVVVSGDGPN